VVDLPERESLIQRKRDVLARFLHVLLPLVSVYKIPQTSLHVFADKEGQLVAFNRGGSLFVNLRYYEAWRMFRVFSPPTSDLSRVDRRSRCRGRGFPQGLDFLVRFPVLVACPLADAISLGISRWRTRLPTTSFIRTIRNMNSISLRSARHILCP
jgi:hypothetical protein